MRRLDFPIISKGTIKVITAMGRTTESDAIKVAMGKVPSKGVVTSQGNNTRRLSKWNVYK